MRKRFSLCKKVGVFLLTAVMCTSQLNVQAEKKYDFETEYQVVAGANGYFIAKNICQNREPPATAEGSLSHFSILFHR